MAREQDADGSAPGFPVVDGSELRAALSTFSSLRGLSTRLKGGDKARQARQQQLVEKASPGPCHPATAARTVPCTASSILSESGITGNASEAAVRSSDNVSNPSSMQSPSAGPIRINVLPTRSPADALNFREGHANRSRPLKLLPALLNRQSSPAAAHRMRPGDESDAEAEGRRENERLGSMLSCESSKPPTPEPRPIAPADRENPQLKIDSAPAGSVNGTSSERTLSGSRRLSEEDRFQAGDHRTLRSLSEAPMLESEIGSNPGSPRTPGVPRRKSFKPLFSKAVRHSRMQSNHSTRSTTNQIFGAMSLLRLKMEIKQEERHEGEGASNNKLIGESIAQAASLQERDEPFVAEGDTGMPVADVHNYMLYCQMHRLTIILRPVADGAAKAFLGVFGITDPSLLDEEGYPILERTEHIPWSHLTDITSLVSNARGKTMATALKSSPYGPIKGTVPLLAQLSKVGAAHAELRSNLEAALIAAEKAQVAPDAASAIVVGKEGLTQAFTRLKTMEATASRMFDKIQADSNRAMVASDMRLQKLLLAYNKASMEVRDKRKVAEMYVDEFNNSQFLGECMARYGPLRRCIHYLVHERENEDGRATLFEEGKLPVFVLPPTSSPATSADPYEKWDYEKGTFVRCPNGLPPRSEALPVKLVSSRHFYISDKTGRIEERAEGAVLVPDYDGLSWADDCVFPESLFCLHDSVGNLTAAIVEHCYGDMKSVLEQSFIDNMGMVSNKDIEHIHEVRCLTDWRQSHGEEANNTVKTQEFLPGNYPCFDSDGKLHVLRNMEDVVRFYRKKWLAGCPLRLNPNWNVILDFEWLPIMPTESIVPLYDRELNEAVVIEKVKHQKCHEWDFPSLKAAYERIFGKDTVEGWRGLPRTKDGKKATELSVWRAYVKYRDEIKVIQLFFRIRSLLLFPPLYLHYRYALSTIPPPMQPQLGRIHAQCWIVWLKRRFLVGNGDFKSGK
ncbi:hypothetical protein DIPPA_05493 [Diplonema papillatum]|nr:hypothetical protein DIPPA_05493 [Diplonema papillatum]